MNSIRKIKINLDEKSRTMKKRGNIPTNNELGVLEKSSRRCCFCFGLLNDDEIKNGQIAHIDHDPSNNEECNLAWLCLFHHNEYDSKTSQSKGLTKKELEVYRKELYEYIKVKKSKFKNELIPGDTFIITCGDTPSFANVRTKDQFIKVSTRHGPVRFDMFEFVKDVLADIRDYNDNLLNSEVETFMLRGIWFDAKHGTANIHIDYLHDKNMQSKMTERTIKELFHEDYGWYNGYHISICAQIFKAYYKSDNYSPLNDEYYNRPFSYE